MHTWEFSKHNTHLVAYLISVVIHEKLGFQSKDANLMVLWKSFWFSQMFWQKLKTFFVVVACLKLCRRTWRAHITLKYLLQPLSYWLLRTWLGFMAIDINLCSFAAVHLTYLVLLLELFSIWGRKTSVTDSHCQSGRQKIKTSSSFLCHGIPSSFCLLLQQGEQFLVVKD